jgi:hypothetical protein
MLNFGHADIEELFYLPSTDIMYISRHNYRLYSRHYLAIETSYGNCENFPKTEYLVSHRARITTHISSFIATIFLSQLLTYSYSKVGFTSQNNNKSIHLYTFFYIVVSQSKLLFTLIFKT